MDVTKHIRAPFLATRLAIGVLLAGAAFAGCGSDDDASSSGPQNAAGNGIDRAFVSDMIPHHESAVDMAMVAERRGQSAFVKKLAEDIIRSQRAEITTLQGIAARLESAGVKAKSLGVPEHQMGMGASMSRLESAKPFDRAFIDMMIPHHQGAIRMARVEIAEGSNAAAKDLATEIIDAQAREIRAMNKHRTEEFGGPSPTGGVPADEATHDGMSGMDHE
ncbi:MAG: DUF305 domain-containing protein [Solirubrobacteraceae bacterium]|nr:DUF305 domain-containing protein [Solirubrobacteraceae bacterium]